MNCEYTWEIEDDALRTQLFQPFLGRLELTGQSVTSCKTMGCFWDLVINNAYLYTWAYRISRKWCDTHNHDLVILYRATVYYLYIRSQQPMKSSVLNWKLVFLTNAQPRPLSWITLIGHTHRSGCWRSRRRSSLSRRSRLTRGGIIGHHTISRWCWGMFLISSFTSFRAIWIISIIVLHIVLYMIRAYTHYTSRRSEWYHICWLLRYICCHIWLLDTIPLAKIGSKLVMAVVQSVIFVGWTPSSPKQSDLLRGCPQPSHSHMPCYCRDHASWLSAPASGWSLRRAPHRWRPAKGMMPAEVYLIKFE